MNLIKNLAQKYLNGEGTLSKLALDYKVKVSDIKKELQDQGYIIKSGYKLSTVIGLKLAVEEYINSKGTISLTKLATKYKMNRRTISNRLKELNYTIINHQNETKFNENIFDMIDTEEKAYWLGFIYADGYIGSSDYKFELSLKYSDIEHLNKFNTFMGHNKNNVTSGIVKLNGKEYKRCRWIITNKHLWTTLNSYGCTPRKSLTLQFPKEEIFKGKSLIRHFIRGYFDGDGCISYNNKEHTIMSIIFLGSEDFLSDLKIYLPLKYDYVLSLANANTNNTITKQITINGKNGLEILNYLYDKSKIHLNRKYERYTEYCRLYSEEYKLLSTQNGEGCDANTVLK
jgi:hypothetical protein